MGKALNGQGEVAIITGQLGAVNLNERIAGIKKGLAKYPGIKIVETQGTDDDLARGVSVVETTLRAHPNLKGIFGVSQVGGPAVAKVLNTKEFGAMKGKLEVLAFDDLPDTLKGAQGRLHSGHHGPASGDDGLACCRPSRRADPGPRKRSRRTSTRGVTVVTKDNMTS